MSSHMTSFTTFFEDEADGLQRFGSHEFDVFTPQFAFGLETLTDDNKITDEELEEFKTLDKEERLSVSVEGSSKTTNLPHFEGNVRVDVGQIASVLLSDTSESDTDSGPNEKIGQMNELDVQTIQEDMYNSIRAEIKKKIHREDTFTKGWVEHQRKMFLKMKKKQKLKQNVTEGGRNVDSSIEELRGDEEIPKLTVLTVKPHFTRKQIGEEMAKMDKEKRDKWEKLFIQFELRKSMRPPVLKSDLRRDFKKLEGTNGREDLVQYYRKALSNLTDDLGSSVAKLEQVMSNMDAKEQPKGVRRNSGDEEQRDEAEGGDVEREMTDVSSASEEEPFLTEEEMDNYEELLSKNLIVAPNLQKIKTMLNTEIVFPEPEREVEQLGCTIREVEQNLLKSKGLDSYITRIVYFYKYSSSCTADSIKTAYEDIVKNVRIAKESESTSNKGCLLIYENVKLAIVMVEGEEFEILKHLYQFKNFLVNVKRGKILYVHRNLLKLYFNKWVIRVEQPRIGKITYLTKSKKVLYRTAAARVVRTSEMLDRLYRHLSKEERYLIDPRSIYIKSKYVVLLPPPSLFGYLLKYNLLRDLKKFVNELGRPLSWSSDEEELFAFAEDVMYSSYVDSDDEEMKADKLSYAKASLKQNRADIKEMNDIKIKDTNEKVSWDEFCMDEITPTIVDGRIKLTEDVEHPAVRLASAIESHQSVFERKVEKCDDSSGKSFLVFLEKGSDRWAERMRWYGVNTSQQVEGETSEVRFNGDDEEEQLPSETQSSSMENLLSEESYTDESSSRSSEESSLN